jgi:hypothetical protein
MLARRLAGAAGLLVLITAAILRVTRPPSPLPATAPDTLFSAMRALRHVAAIAERPHAMGTADHDRVRDYIIAQLGALGLSPAVQATTAIGTRYQAAGHVENVLARLPGRGTDRNAVLLVAHYDGVEAGPAASDDGAGAAAILEVLRAVRARRSPLEHDIIALFTDGEESGLLGAAAFVREHPWAKDVAFAINLEARGTSGRSYMFETGPDNLDAARALRSAGDVTAGSVFTAVYRALPNDTDLSELSALELPALNFAFAQGVERYHTSRDDPAHLDPGSLQHHGQQMLATASTVANEPLPRPRIGDGVFFDLPVIGLVVYPTWLALPLACVALLLFILIVYKNAHSRLGSWLAMLVSLGICLLLALLARLSGPAVWSGLYAGAIALAAASINVAAYLWASRRDRNARYAALSVWVAVALVCAFVAPGVSYLFTWPVLFALVAARSRRPAAEWIAAAVTLSMVGGLAYAAPVIMLGLAGIGVFALVLLVALIVWLIAPTFAIVFSSARAALLVLNGLAAVVLLIAVTTVKQSADHPARSALIYAESSAGAGWFGTLTPHEPWSRTAVGTANGPAWTMATNEQQHVLTGHAVPRASLEAPSAILLGDSLIGAHRRVTVRVTAPRGTTVLLLGVPGSRVFRTAIDGREVSTTRYRYRQREWAMEFWNVPDSGAVFSLDVDAGARLSLNLAARRPGLPAALTPVTRPANVVPSQTGDVSVVYRGVVF